MEAAPHLLLSLGIPIQRERRGPCWVGFSYLCPLEAERKGTPSSLNSPERGGLECPQVSSCREAFPAFLAGTSRVPWSFGCCPHHAVSHPPPKGRGQQQSSIPPGSSAALGTEQSLQVLPGLLG